MDSERRFDYYIISVIVSLISLILEVIFFIFAIRSWKTSLGRKSPRRGVKFGRHMILFYMSLFGSAVTSTIIRWCEAISAKKFSSESESSFTYSAIYTSFMIVSRVCDCFVFLFLFTLSVFSFSNFLSDKRSKKRSAQKLISVVFFVIIGICLSSVVIYIIYDIVQSHKYKIDPSSISFSSMEDSPGFHLICRIIIGIGIQSLLAIATCIYLLYVDISTCAQKARAQDSGLKHSTKQQRCVSYKLFLMAFLNSLISIPYSILILRSSDDAQVTLGCDIALDILFVLNSTVFISKYDENEALLSLV
ncbi:hypothetical protein ADUPG1_013850 [Aduncisulcus paluster]|uniref:Vomeronasal type-1 receptor n=1 Tax=Aduncisulcus paluster TaxID=2918883 RepID=A0ABQ5K4F8_9EUKA|nr:hypothetical protein ADUPG1_013850 [Aduncisulcus paluster]